MKNDGCMMLLQSARTLALRCAVALPEGETKDRTHLALAALGDAIEARGDELTQTAEAA